jgi:predicted metalloprotease with PDZ domain
MTKPVLLLLSMSLLASAADSESTIRPIPPALDVARPGLIRLSVDASDVTRGIFHVTEIVPVTASGPLTLLYPEWIPGKHRPFGDASKLAGLTVTANGRPVSWRRDPLDVFAFHIDVPPGTAEVELRFQFLSATAEAQGRIVATPDLLNLQWESVSLYPAGHYTRRIMVAPVVRYPDGWTAASALEVEAKDGATVRYKAVDYETLVDSPVMAGAHARIETLAPGVRLNIFADQPEQLAATEEQLQLHRNLVTQALKLFGGRHYDRYDFLLALSSRLGGIGLEHQRSSENGVEPAYFTDWKGSLDDHDLLPHEYVHSWNGKYRRPAGHWTPDFRTPMQDELLWVYEGQTQFWGCVLAARAGLLSKEDTLASFALVAATYEARAGRKWRPLLDTTNDPVVSGRRPKGWTSWQRNEDYYQEGQLLWLEADSLIRELSGGARSLEDFARAFFGLNDGDLGVLTYTFEDVVRTLNQVQPYDWAAFLRERVESVREHAPLDWLARAGYRLVFTDTPTDFFKAVEKKRKVTDLTYSGGLILGKEGEVSGVLWDSPAFAAGLTVGSRLVALNGRTFDADKFKAAIKARQPLSLLVRSGDVFRTVELQYDGGLRYPRLERIPGSTAAGLDLLLAPKS